MDNKFELPREGVRIYDPKSGWQDSAENKQSLTDRAENFEPGLRPDGEDRSADDPDAGDAAYDEPYDDHEHDDALHDDENDIDDHDDHHREEQRFEEPVNHVSEEQFSEEGSEAGTKYEAQRSFSDSQAQSPESFAAEALRSLSDNLSSTGALAAYSGSSRGKSAAGLVPQGQAAALAKVGDSLDGLFTVIQRSTLANTVDGSAPSWRDVANISRHLEGRLNTRQQLLKELSSVDREIRNTRDDLLVTLKALSEFEQQNLQAASMRASISSVAARVIAKRFEESGGD